MRGRALAALVIAVLCAGAGTGYAQRIFAGFYGTAPPRRRWFVQGEVVGLVDRRST